MKENTDYPVSGENGNISPEDELKKQVEIPEMSEIPEKPDETLQSVMPDLGPDTEWKANKGNKNFTSEPNYPSGSEFTTPEIDFTTAEEKRSSLNAEFKTEALPPEEPVQPVQAGQSVKPAQFEQPTKPTQPAQPVQPEQLAQSAQPEQPAKAAQIENPVQPQEGRGVVLPEEFVKPEVRYTEPAAQEVIGIRQNTSETSGYIPPSPPIKPVTMFASAKPVTPSTSTPAKPVTLSTSAKPVTLPTPSKPENAQQKPTNGEYKWNFSDYSQYNIKTKKQKKSGGLVAALVIMAALLVALTIMFSYYIITEGELRTSSEKESEETSGRERDPNAPNLNIEENPSGGVEAAAAARLDELIKKASAKASPSVVGIVVYARGYGLQHYGEGSGVIMREDGYIISNAHVFIKNNTEIDFFQNPESRYVDGIKVVLSNGEEYEADIIGTDENTDLAVIKVDAKGLPVAEFGNSDKTEVGETVIAIGNPGGLDFFGSVTSGIISGINRNTSTGGYATSLIQTDAAINPGNSGGPLVNMHGQVIGINSSKIVELGYEGIGFAIPISEAKPIIDDLIAHGYVKGRVRIGIKFRQVIDEVAARVNNVMPGILIDSVDENMDAAKKGIRRGDIITKINGKNITAASHLTDILKTKKPNDVVKLTIYRDAVVGISNTFDVDVVLSEDVKETE
ncbi:MAG: trypsin-like peptidase domain-containing protein [Oscillospiraceae bacterium]|nr:trypsin-like peptidase domain-containing protein [Oscillospiraceae bacterium]